MEDVNLNRCLHIDFGGIYQVDPTTKKITYTDKLDQNPTWNVYWISDSIKQQSAVSGATAFFESLHNISDGYDFAKDKQFRDQQKLTRFSIAYNFAINAQYKLNRNEPLSLRFGFHCQYAPNIGSHEKYVPVERTTDKFNSFFNSNGKSTYLAYGITVGVAYSLGK